jgi:hypothetical protein
MFIHKDVSYFLSYTLNTNIITAHLHSRNYVYILCLDTIGTTIFPKFGTRWCAKNCLSIVIPLKIGKLFNVKNKRIGERDNTTKFIRGCVL